MTSNLIHASIQHKLIIENLMQFYMYDFSEFMELNITNEGKFKAYEYLDEYWTDMNRFPYLIKCNNSPAGFALVRWIEDETAGYFSVAEFFVLKKYRRSGIGFAIARQLFSLHKGKWEIFQRENNIPAQLFWQKVIDVHTGGSYSNKFEAGKWIQRFEAI